MGPGRKHAALPPRWVTANSHRRRRRWRHPPEKTRLGWGPPRRGVGAWPAHCAHRPTAAGGWPLSLRGRARRAGERERARCPFVLQPLLNKPLTFTGCTALMSLSVLMSVRSSKDNAPQPSACIRVTGGPLVRYDTMELMCYPRERNNKQAVQNTWAPSGESASKRWPLRGEGRGDGIAAVEDTPGPPSSFHTQASDTAVRLMSSSCSPPATPRPTPRCFHPTPSSWPPRPPHPPRNRRRPRPQTAAAG